LDPCGKISEVLVKVLRVSPPRQIVHARSGIALERKERDPEQIDTDMVLECGELLLFPLPCGLPYTSKRL
jgi:hypothetical protein